jgi:cell division protein FtsZ
VLGIGGCGISAINRMIEKGIQGAEFCAISSDVQELARCKTDQRLHLFCTQKRRNQIRALIFGADIVLIVTGMGGDTGTCIAPIAAEIARELGILNVAIVSTPFRHEGNRPHHADQGIQALSKHADALIVIPNAMLLTEADMRVPDVFAAANRLMHTAASGIAESISGESLICVDMADLHMIFANAGRIAMGTADASGADRATVACKHALSGIFPSTANWTNARTILLNISASRTLKLQEVAEIMNRVQFAAKDAVIVATAVLGDSMSDDLRLTLYASEAFTSGPRP